jgi:RNA polymerase sigma-70 factor (ECF subfamily)
VSEQTWFAELYDRCYERLVLAAYAMTNDLGVAEEITQEAFAIAYGRARRVSRADSPEAWLRTVVVNLVRRRYRRHAMLDRILVRQQAEPPPPDDPPDEHLDLHDAIRGLGQEHRTVVVLHYLADLPLEEVSAVLGVPVGTVKSRLSRARAALAERLRTEVDHV